MGRVKESFWVREQTQGGRGGKNSIDLGNVGFGRKDAAIYEYLDPFECFERSKVSPMELRHSVFGFGRSTREDQEETPS